MLKHRSDIQSLRGVAVLAVVLFHFDHNLFPKGYLGVDIFFVISGFVITPLMMEIFDGSTDKKYFNNLKQFYIKRFYRLAPASLVMLYFSAIIIVLFCSPIENSRFARQGIATLLSLGNFGAYSYSGDYFSQNPNILVHTWSLAIEVQMYIILPLFFLCIFIWSKSKIKNVYYSASTILVISIVIFIFPKLLQPLYNIFEVRLIEEFNFYSPLSRIWQFLLGGIGSLFLSDLIKTSKLNKSLSIMILFSTFLIVFSKFNVNLQFSSIIVSLTTFLGLIFMSIELIPKRAKTVLEWLGDRSYSIYLYHVPLLYVATYSPVFQTGGNSNLLARVIAIFGTIIMSNFSYILIENKYRKSMLFPRTQLISFVVVLFVIFSAIDIGSRERYWGLEAANVVAPKVAWGNDPKCPRDGWKPCVYKHGNSTKTVLLIGDSHASHFSQSVIDAADAIGWNTVTWGTGGCPLTFIAHNFITKECAIKNQEALEFIKVTKPNAVIISEWLMESGKDEHSNFRSAILEIKKYSPNTLLVGNTITWPDTNIFGRRLPILLRSYLPAKTLPKSDLYGKNMQTSAIFMSWAVSNEIEILDLNYLYCGVEECNRYDSLRKEYLFSDSSHLSLLGASLAVNDFKFYLEKIDDQS